MRRNLIDLGAKPLLDIASYARRGPGRRDRLSPDEVELIRRTVTRTPEVMVKVLTRGGQDLGAIRAHLSYLHRKGELEIETDQGERLAGRHVEKRLLEDWDLDVEQHRRRADLKPGKDRSPPKLVHKILFSMPPGTPPQKVLQAVTNFAREEFGLKHRYAMVLHTDEPHPHVHVVVKAVSEHGARLNIRKETLRRWRTEFARHLREQGVDANATDRAVRGVTAKSLRDPIYRAMQDGRSTFMRYRVESLSLADSDAKLTSERGEARLLQTRLKVDRGWRRLVTTLAEARYASLASDTARFQSHLPAVATDKRRLMEQIGAISEKSLRNTELAR